MVTSNYQNKLTTNILCDILTVKLNHNITKNLPIELLLWDIEDGTMCVLRTLTVFEIQCGMNPIDDNYQRLEQWASRMHPLYNEFEQYEGASWFVTPFGVIRSSKQLEKKNKNDVNMKQEKKLQHLHNTIALF